MGLSVGISVVCIIVGIIVAITCKTRQSQRRKQMMDWWRITSDELQPLNKSVTKSGFSNNSGSSTLHSTVHGSKATTVRSEGGFNVCLYKGGYVQRKFLSKGHIQVTFQILREFEEIRDLMHPNLLRVIGADLVSDKPFIVTEHCPKGTLQELLLSDNHFELDLLFQSSLILDIVNALTYLHKRFIYHGRLTSEVCMIDTRFSVKLDLYCLPTLYDTIKLKTEEESKEKDRLWVAPEHLRTGCKTGSMQGDIYSLAIIISEVISREEPYSNDKDYLTTREVLYKVQFPENPPFRPALTCPTELISLERLMKQCWEEDPKKRPALNDIYSTLFKMAQEKGGKHGSLVDTLLNRLEKYRYDT